MSKIEEAWREKCGPIWQRVFLPKKGTSHAEWTGKSGLQKHSIQLRSATEGMSDLLWESVSQRFRRANLQFSREEWDKVFSDVLSKNVVAGARRDLSVGFKVLNAFESEYSSATEEIHRARRRELTQIYISRMATSISLAAILLATYYVAGKLSIVLPMMGRLPTVAT